MIRDASTSAMSPGVSRTGPPTTSHRGGSSRYGTRTCPGDVIGITRTPPNNLFTSRPRFPGWSSTADRRSPCSERPWPEGLPLSVYSYEAIGELRFRGAYHSHAGGTGLYTAVLVPALPLFRSQDAL